MKNWINLFWKETHMMKKRELKIRSSYEPNRLGKIYLHNAYAKLTPQIKRFVHADNSKLLNLKEDNLIPTLRRNIK